VQIVGGSGCDEVGICDTYIGGNLVIQTLGGDDWVGIFDSKTEGITRVLTANGCNDVEIEEFCTQNLVVRTGNHADNVYLACVAIHEDLVIQTLNGCDEVEIDECCDREYDNPEVATFEEGECCCEYVNWVGDSVIIQTGDGESDVDVYSLSAYQVNITGGNDYDEVDVECVETYLNLRINTLDGCDDVDVSDVSVFSLIITTGLGDDVVFIGSEYCGNYFEADLVVRTDGGDDSVLLGSDLATITTTSDGGDEFNKSYVGDDLVIETGDGTDLIGVLFYCVGEDVVINAGAGDDSSCYYGEGFGENSANGSSEGGVYLDEIDIGRHLTVLLGDGADSLELDDVCVEGNATIDAGPGDDSGGNNNDVGAQNGNGYGRNAGVWIEDLFVKNNFFLYLGAGHDDAHACDVEVCGNAYIYGGADCDYVELDRFDVHKNLFVFMGGGDDKLSVDCSSAEVARFYGDGGYDEFCEGSNSFGQQFVYSFESWYV
jgi:hypothetical protein